MVFIVWIKKGELRMVPSNRVFDVEGTIHTPRSREERGFLHSDVGDVVVPTRRNKLVNKTASHNEEHLTPHHKLRHKELSKSSSRESSEAPVITYRKKALYNVETVLVDGNPPEADIERKLQKQMLKQQLKLAHTHVCSDVRIRTRKAKSEKRMPFVWVEADCESKNTCSGCRRAGGQIHPLYYNMLVLRRVKSEIKVSGYLYRQDMQKLAVSCVCKLPPR